MFSLGLRTMYSPMAPGVFNTEFTRSGNYGCREQGRRAVYHAGGFRMEINTDMRKKLDRKTINRLMRIYKFYVKLYCAAWGVNCTINYRKHNQVYKPYPNYRGKTIPKFMVFVSFDKPARITNRSSLFVHGLLGVSRDCLSLMQYIVVPGGVNEERLKPILDVKTRQITQITSLPLSKAENRRKAADLLVGVHRRVLPYYQESHASPLSHEKKKDAFSSKIIKLTGSFRSHNATDFERCTFAK